MSKPFYLHFHSHRQGEAVFTKSNDAISPDSFRVIDYNAYEELLALAQVISPEHFEVAEQWEKLVERNRAMKSALEYIMNREDFSFTECSEAEKIWNKAKKALE